MSACKEYLKNKIKVGYLNAFITLEASYVCIVVCLTLICMICVPIGLYSKISKYSRECMDVGKIETVVDETRLLNVIRDFIDSKEK